jgi:ABC-type transport system involved in cytochrome bd biosynthesis fused ATPase/permease subunit
MTSVAVTALAIAGLIWVASVLILVGLFAAALIADWIAKRRGGGIDAEIAQMRREGLL